MRKIYSLVLCFGMLAVMACSGAKKAEEVAPVEEPTTMEQPATDGAAADTAPATEGTTGTTN